MNPQAMLNYLLGVTEGSVLYSIYLDCANKLQDIGTGKGFDINEDGYVPKSYNTITDFTGLLPDTIRGVIERLIKKGLLEKKPGNEDTYNIPLYRPEFKSSVFIEIAKERLKTPPKNKLNQKSDERFLPQIIETLEKNQYVMIALGLVKEGHRSWFTYIEIKKKPKETEEALQEEALQEEALQEEALQEEALQEEAKVIPMKKQA